MNPLLRQLKTSVSTYHVSALNETLIWIPLGEDSFYNSIKVDHMQIYASHREPGGSETRYAGCVEPSYVRTFLLRDRKGKQNNPHCLWHCQATCRACTSLTSFPSVCVELAHALVGACLHCFRIKVVTTCSKLSLEWVSSVFILAFLNPNHTCFDGLISAIETIPCLALLLDCLRATIETFCCCILTVFHRREDGALCFAGRTSRSNEVLGLTESK